MNEEGAIVRLLVLFLLLSVLHIEVKFVSHMIVSDDWVQLDEGVWEMMYELVMVPKVMTLKVRVQLM